MSVALMGRLQGLPRISKVSGNTNRKMIVSTGVAYYPEARENIAIKLINKYTKVKEMSNWEHYEGHMLEAIEMREAVFVKPVVSSLNYLHLPFAMSMYEYGIPAEKTVVVYPHFLLPFGQIRISASTDGLGSYHLGKAVHGTDSFDFITMGIGVQRSIQSKRQLSLIFDLDNDHRTEKTIYYRCKWNKEQEECIERYIFPTFSNLLDELNRVDSITHIKGTFGYRPEQMIQAIKNGEDFRKIKNPTEMNRLRKQIEKKWREEGTDQTERLKIRSRFERKTTLQEKSFYVDEDSVTNTLKN
jgi:peptidyl-tRNA hydrolase